MAKTDAERQHAMRARRTRGRIGADIPERERGEGEQRLDIWIRTNAKLALEHIAERRGLSCRHALEQLLLEAADREL